ncbi:MULTISPECIES: hypothetical protein [Vitreoscilla]|uniref:Uncharacterized protein n=1 Tax=Vitreoscilla stercoraria TaxID=61 RepID=A0ABY4E9M9_VITST|nr:MULTISPECIES: hypothetical protein [Vitreoscilla]AUZ03975.1 hypothetical protein ADP71_01420 [Vitreoscilla sp. C1]UOO92105.1 hypothetical protein LVJ81_10805 [Vitreoscilla stercoraria]
MKKHVLLLIAIVIVAAIMAKIIAVVAFTDTKTVQALDAPQITCELEKNCVLDAQTQVKSLERLRLNQPFHVVLQSNTPVEEVSVSFSMTDMEIGYNRYKLTTEDGKTWKTEIKLPFCTLSRADYIATWRVGGRKYESLLNVTD